MLLSKSVLLKWNSKIKKHYTDLGYVFTNMKDIFEVNTNDLTDGSSAIVNVKCDYCGKIYTKHWNHYIIENKKSNINKDACFNCKHIKAKESVIDTYGCENVFQLDEVKEKISKTNIEKYGVKNPFQSEEIKEKIYNLNYEKYGCKIQTQSEDAKERMRNMCIEKYGIPYMPQLNIAHKKGSENPRWKGGAEVNGLYRSTYEYKDWRNIVLKRDYYTCKCCGIKSGIGKRVILHVHHIFNFADNFDLKYDVDNGICLCKECHKNFHRIYGVKNTTKSQLDEFILNHDKKIC